jgi:signal transduction histidine kinase
MRNKVIITISNSAIAKSVSQYIEQLQYDKVSTDYFSFISSQDHLDACTLWVTHLPGDRALEKEKIKKVHQMSPELPIIPIGTEDDVDFFDTLLEEQIIYDYMLTSSSYKKNLHTLKKAMNHTSVQEKLRTYSRTEENFFEDMVKIFDWKKELQGKQNESIAANLIHQINISFMQGEGFSSLISILSTAFSKSVYFAEEKVYKVRENIFNLIKENYISSQKMLKSLSVAQTFILEATPYSTEMQLSELEHFLQELVSGLYLMFAIKYQKVFVGQVQTGKKISFIFDKEKMRYVIKELLINAMKYSGEKDSIYVLPFVENNTLNLKFINPAYPNPDGSLGITDRNETRVFEPFYRISSVVDDRYNDEDFKFGLGLSIVKKIVELHKATISVYTVSDNIHPSKKGKDVCFSIRFPLTKET